MIDDELDKLIMGTDMSAADPPAQSTTVGSSWTTTGTDVADPPAQSTTGPVGPSKTVTVMVSPNGPWGVSLPTGVYAVPNMWSQLNFNFSGDDEDKEEDTNPNLKVAPKVKIENPVCSDCKLVFPYAEVYKGDTFTCKGCQLLLDTWT